MKLNNWRLISLILTCILLVAIWTVYETNKTTTSRINVLQKEREFLSEKMEYFQKLKKNIETELATSKENEEILLAKLNEYEDNIEKLTGELESLNVSIVATETILSNKDYEIGNLETKILAYQKENNTLKEKLKFLTGSDEVLESDIVLDPIVVASKKNIRTGRVLEVNQKYDFLVINLGRKEGLKSGDILFVERGRKLLGKVLVELVSEKTSTAKIMYKPLKDTVKKGDMVTF